MQLPDAPPPTSTVVDDAPPRQLTVRTRGSDEVADDQGARAPVAGMDPLAIHGIPRRKNRLACAVLKRSAGVRRKNEVVFANLPKPVPRTLADNLLAKGLRVATLRSEARKSCDSAIRKKCLDCLRNRK